MTSRNYFIWIKHKNQTRGDLITSHMNAKFPVLGSQRLPQNTLSACEDERIWVHNVCTAYCTLWQKCWVVMLKTSRHSEAFFSWACRVCSCSACCSQRSLSCWIRARSSSWARSVRAAAFAAAVRPRATQTHSRVKIVSGEWKISSFCKWYLLYNACQVCGFDITAAANSNFCTTF